MAGLHLRQHVQALEDEVSAGNERFADVEAREVVALEELHFMARLSDERAGGGAGGAAADDDDVGFGGWERFGTGHRFSDPGIIIDLGMILIQTIVV